MNYLLDTCVLSEYKKLQPNRNVVDWLDGQVEDSLFLSVLTIGELEKGIVKMPASKRKKNLEDFLDTLIVRFDRRLIDLDIAILRRWGALAGTLETQGRTLPVMDTLIAATALEYNLTVVTRNESDFVTTGARILNVWQ